MTNVQLINGSWSQTLATILYEINQKLNDTEIDDIIRKIDETIADEELLQLSNQIINRVSNIETDNIEIKNNIINLLNLISNLYSNTLSIKNEVDVLRVDNEFIKSKINSVSKRLNSISVVNEIRLVEKEIPKGRIVRPTYEPPVIIEVQPENTTFLMDMELKEGYTESLKIYKTPSQFTYDTRLSWLIKGNRRRLLWKKSLEVDMIFIYNKYGIYDLDIIRESQLEIYNKK